MNQFEKEATQPVLERVEENLKKLLKVYSS